MKKIIALVAICAFFGFVFAQNATAPAAAPAPEKAAKKSVAVKALALSGTITAVDTALKTVSVQVKGKKGAEPTTETITVNDKTVIKVNGKVAALDALKVGNMAAVSYADEAGSKVAKEIKAKEAVAKKAGVKKAEAAAAAPAAK
jgi:hypothetical protein